MASPAFLPPSVSSDMQHVKIVVPYSNQTSRLRLFLDFIRSLMNIDRNFSVVLVNFIDNPSAKHSQESSIRRLMSKSLENERLLDRIDIVSIAGQFSRGLALNSGAKFVKGSCSNCTLFFCDVDVTFTQEMLNRCRLLAEPSKSVYFPILFSQFNPQLSKIHMAKFDLLINENSGIWRNFGYGMSCVHASDFSDSLHFPEYRKWGSEDDKFHSKVLNAGLLVYRIPDPGLIHAYHSKNCSSAVNKISCYKSKSIVEGNSIQLGMELFSLKEKFAATSN